MNVVSDIQSDILTIQIDIPESAYKAEFDAQVRAERKKSTLKGFRPGQAPMGLIERMVGPQIRTDLIFKHVGEISAQVLEEQGQLPVTTPQLTEDSPALDVRTGGDKQVKVQFYVTPQYHIPEGQNLTSHRLVVDAPFMDKVLEQAATTLSTQSILRVVDNETRRILLSLFPTEGEDRTSIGMFTLDFHSLSDTQKAPFLGKRMGDQVKNFAVEDIVPHLSQQGNDQAPAELTGEYHLEISQVWPEEFCNQDLVKVILTAFNRPTDTLPESVPELRELLQTTLQEEYDTFAQMVRALEHTQALASTWLKEVEISDGAVVQYLLENNPEASGLQVEDLEQEELTFWKLHILTNAILSSAAHITKEEELHGLIPEPESLTALGRIELLFINRQRRLHEYFSHFLQNYFPGVMAAMFERSIPPEQREAHAKQLSHFYNNLILSTWILRRQHEETLDIPATEWVNGPHIVRIADSNGEEIFSSSAPAKEATSEKKPSARKKPTKRKTEKTEKEDQ